MSRDSKYIPPLTDGEIIQIAAARRAGDILLRQTTGKIYAESAADLTHALRHAGIIPQRICSADEGATVIAVLRIVPPNVRAGRRIIKREPVQIVVLTTFAGRVHLVDGGGALEINAPVSLLAACYDTFERVGAFNAESGEIIKRRLLWAIGHAENTWAVHKASENALQVAMEDEATARAAALIRAFSPTAYAAIAEAA